MGRANAESAFFRDIERSKYQDQNNKRNEYVERSNRLRKEFEAKRVIDNTQFLGGYNSLTMQQIEQAQAKTNMLKAKRLELAKLNPQLHTMLRNAIDVFIHLEEFNKASLQPHVSSITEIFNTGQVKVHMKVNRCLTNALKVEFFGTYQKCFHIKAESFDQDRAVVKEYRQVPFEVSSRVKYGDFFQFERSLFKPLIELIRQYDINDTSKSETIDTNIWEFNF